VLWVVWSCLLRVCEVRRCTTHTANRPYQQPQSPARSLKSSAASTTSSAKHSSPLAVRVRGKAIDAPHGNGSREQVGHSARRHTNIGMRTQRILGSGGITPTLPRSSAALLVVHGELGALGVRFAPREHHCEQPCILQSWRGCDRIGFEASLPVIALQIRGHKDGRRPCFRCAEQSRLLAMAVVVGVVACPPQVPTYTDGTSAISDAADVSEAAK